MNKTTRLSQATIQEPIPSPTQQTNSIGIGFNSATGQLQPTSALNSTESDTLIPDVQTVYTLKLVTDYDSLSTELSIDADVGIGGVVDAKTRFARSVRFTQFNVNLLVRVVQVFNTYTLKKPALADSAITLLKAGAVEQFLQQYGDKFVKGVTKGGELLAVVAFVSTTTVISQQIGVDISAVSGTFFGSANLREKLDELRNREVLNVLMYRTGAVSPVPSWDQFIDYANQFPVEIAKAPEHATEIEREFADYYVAERPLGTPTPPRLIEQVDALRLIAGFVRSLEALLSEYDIASQVPELFTESDLPQFQKMVAEQRTQTQQLRDGQLAIAKQIDENYWLAPPPIKAPDITKLFAPAVLDKFIPTFTILYADQNGNAATAPSGRWVGTGSPMAGFEGQMSHPVPGLNIWYCYRFWSKPFKGGAFLHVSVLQGSVTDFLTSQSASEGWLSMQFGLSGDRAYIYRIKYKSVDTQGKMHESADGGWCGVEYPTGYETIGNTGPKLVRLNLNIRPQLQF
jgi:hypothetical protein